MEPIFRFLNLFDNLAEIWSVFKIKLSHIEKNCQIFLTHFVNLCFASSVYKTIIYQFVKALYLQIIYHRFKMRHIFYTFENFKRKKWKEKRRKKRQQIESKKLLVLLAMARSVVLLSINGGLLLISKIVLFCLFCSPGLNQRGKVKINCFHMIFKEEKIIFKYSSVVVNLYGIKSNGKPTLLVQCLY